MVVQAAPAKWRKAGADGPLATRRFHISTAVLGSFLRRSEAGRSAGIEAGATLIAPYSIDFHSWRRSPCLAGAWWRVPSAFGPGSPSTGHDSGSAGGCSG